MLLLSATLKLPAQRVTPPALAAGLQEQSPALPNSTQQSPAPPNSSQPTPPPTAQREEQSSTISRYEGKAVDEIQLPGVAQRDWKHLLQLLPQKEREPLDRNHVRDSIRALYATGRFADIQAEVVPSGDGVTLTFNTSANFFVGAVEVEGAPSN